MSDLIDRQEAVEHCKKRLYETALNNDLEIVSYIMQEIADNRIDIWLKELPSAQPEIIKCKDCYLRYTSCPMVMRHGNALIFFTKDEDFCSRGKGEEE